MIVIRPDGMDIIEWCDSTSDNISRFVPVMKIEKPEQWPSWGEHAVNVLRSAGVIIPNPRQFPDFVEWASRFNQAIANL
jgi:hypothetical protein